MQKLHLWFARRRKNHTQCLRSKWLNYISTLEPLGKTPQASPSLFPADPNFVSQSVKTKSALIKASAVIPPTSSVKPKQLAPKAMPWDVLGAGVIPQTLDKGANNKRRQSNLRASF